MPPGTRQLSSDAFSTATRSTLPSFSVCAAATEVTTATCGRMSEPSAAISPGALVPTSQIT